MLKQFSNLAKLLPPTHILRLDKTSLQIFKFKLESMFEPKVLRF